MQEHHRSTTAIIRAPKLTAVVLFLTGGLVGIMAYQGTTDPLIWVLAVLLGIRFRNRFPRSDATWREPVTVFTLLVAGGVLGAIAYHDAPDGTSVRGGLRDGTRSCPHRMGLNESIYPLAGTLGR